MAMIFMRSRIFFSAIAVAGRAGEEVDPGSECKVASHCPPCDDLITYARNFKNIQVPRQLAGSPQKCAQRTAIEFSCVSVCVRARMCVEVSSVAGGSGRRIRGQKRMRVDPISGTEMAFPGHRMALEAPGSGDTYDVKKLEHIHEPEKTGHKKGVSVPPPPSFGEAALVRVVFT